jgi:hypothetical protein
MDSTHVEGQHAMDSAQKSDRLKVFISSTMTELRDVREVVSKALDNRGINVWLYETGAGLFSL